MSEETLFAELRGIMPPDTAAEARCLAHWDSIAKPVGSLGLLEELFVRIAGMTGSEKLDLSKKCVLVFCADNGVVKQGVSQSGSSVTTAIARMLAGGRSGVCSMARVSHAEVVPVDVGMVETVPGMLLHKLAHGTADITEGPAMSRAQAIEGIEFGMALAREKAAAGFRLLATGEVGIGNTTTASAVVAALLSLPAERVTGRGAGLSDEGLLRKRAAIGAAIRVNAPDPADALDVLSKLGGFDIAAMTGAFLGAALARVPIVIDGLISGAAALLAVRLCPAVTAYLLPSHETAEPAGAALLVELGLSPLIRAGLRLGEGTGAVALFPLLDMAYEVYAHGATFADIAVEAYKRNP